MPIIPKSRTIQFRVDPDLFEAFSSESDAVNSSVSESLRMLMRTWISHQERRRKQDESNVAFNETLKKRRLAAEKARGGAPLPLSRQERRAAERAARKGR